MRAVSKKGQGLSVTYIVIIALSLIVLILIALWFTGSLKFLTGKQKGVVGASGQEKALWRSNCELWCSLENKESYETHEFGDEKLTCSSLIGRDYDDCKPPKQGLTVTEGELGV